MFINKLYINMAIAVILGYKQSLYDLPEPIYKNKACAQPQKGRGRYRHDTTKIFDKI